MNNNETFFFMLNKYNVLMFGCTQNGKEKKNLIERSEEMTRHQKRMKRIKADTKKQRNHNTNIKRDRH